MKSGMALLSTALLCWTSLGSAQTYRAEKSAALQTLAESAAVNLRPDPPLSIPQFCAINGLRDQQEVMELFGNDFVMTNAWMGAFLPTYEARTTLLNVFLLRTPVTLVQAARPFSALEAVTCGKTIDAFNTESMDQQDVARATALQSAYFCKDLTLTHLATCTKLVPQLMELVRPHDDTNLFDTWKIVLTEPVYIKVLKEVTLANLQAIATGVTPKTTLYDDLLNKFRTELKDDEKAIEATFNVLGVLSSNGNNTWDYIPCKSEAQDSGFKSTIKLLGLANAVLDRMTASQGFLYSYPKQVNSLCDYGKGYHFWMAAYLARRGAQLTNDPIGSAAAAFTLNKGYQFMKEDSGRDRRRAFRENTYANYVNNMRLDMIQAAAGAWFGALSASGEPVRISSADFERGLRLMFAGAMASPENKTFEFPRDSDTAALIAAYSVWKKTLNPDAAFFHFKKALGK